MNRVTYEIDQSRLPAPLWYIIAGLVSIALFALSDWLVLGQLRHINRIYTHHTIIDLDQYQILFHFSKVSAFTAIGLLVIPYAWAVAIPNLLTDIVGYAFGALFSVFALLAFLWPLIGVHNLLVEAKAHALRENATMLKEMRRQLFEQVNLRAVAEATDFHDTLAAIRGEREASWHVPTWQPGTPRHCAAALALPLVGWLLQSLLQKVLGG